MKLTTHKDTYFAKRSGIIQINKLFCSFFTQTILASHSPRRLLRRISIRHRIAIQPRIEHLQHIRQGQKLAPRRLSADRPRNPFVLDHHLQNVRGQGPVAGGQRIADRPDHIDVAGSQLVHRLRNACTSGSRTQWIAEELLIIAKGRLYFLYVKKKHLI